MTTNVITERSKKLDVVKSYLAVARHWGMEAEVVLDALEYARANPEADLHDVLCMKSSIDLGKKVRHPLATAL